MEDLRIALNDIGPEGLELTVDDPAVWAEPCGEFHIPVKVVERLVAKVQLFPQEDGCLVRGRITGKVGSDCNRCGEETLVDIDQSFDEFEPYPDGELTGEDAELDAILPSIKLISQGKNGQVLDLGALLWEEFSLSLPVKPLCSPECKGICPRCGANFNHETCDCEVDEGDPRLAALRGLKIKQ